MAAAEPSPHARRPAGPTAAFRFKTDMTSACCYASALRNVPFALLLLALIAATAAAQHNFTDCGSTKLVPSAVFFFPDPPVKGSDWKVGFKAAALDVIQNGTITITVSIWGIPGLSHSVDIRSREAGPEGFPTCPFQQPISILDTNPGLPWFAPDGPYEGRFEIKDTNGVTFFCLTTSWMQANNTITFSY